MRNRPVMYVGVCAAAAIALMATAGPASPQDRSTIRDNNGLPRYNVQPDPTRPGNKIIRDSGLGLQRGYITPDPTWPGGKRETIRDNNGLPRATRDKTK